MLLHNVGAAVGYAVERLQDNAHMRDDFEADQRENDDRQQCDGQQDEETAVSDTHAALLARH